MAYTVSKDVYVMLNGERYLLESGDKVSLCTEGLSRKIFERVGALLANPKTRKVIADAVAKFVHNKFGTTDPEELLIKLAQKIDIEKIKQSAKRVESVLDVAQTASEDVVKEDVVPAEMINELMGWLATFAYGGMSAGALLYLWVVHDLTPMDSIRWLEDKIVEISNKPKKQTKKKTRR